MQNHSSPVLGSQITIHGGKVYAYVCVVLIMYIIMYIYIYVILTVYII